MGLLDFGTDSNEILWMGEAISTGVVKEGELCKVISITRTADGRGYLLETEYKGNTVYDYAWKKGKTGSTLGVIFDDPASADNNAIFCKAQSKIKNACLVAKEEKKVTWELREEVDKTVLFFRSKMLTSVPQETGKSDASVA